MFKSLSICMAMFILAGVCNLKAAEDIPFTSEFDYTNEVLVNPQLQPAYSDYIEFKALPNKPGMTAVLKLNMRLVTSTLGGWNPYAAIEINGKELNQMTPKNMPRTLLRGGILHTTYPSEARIPYIADGDHNKIVTMFAPANTEQLDPRIIDSQFGYEYYFNVDDLVSKLIIGADDRVENNAPNSIRFINLLNSNVSKAPLLVRGIQLGYIPSDMISELSGEKLDIVERIANPAAKLNGKEYELLISKHGGMELVVNDTSFFFEAAFSYPASPIMKYDRLGIQKNTLEEESKVEISQINDDEAIVRMITPTVELSRHLKIGSHYIKVYDSLKNPTENDRGIVWENEMFLAGKMPDNGWRISGLTNSVSSNSYNAPTNPTVFASDSKAAVGVVAEDSITRSLLLSTVKGNKFSMASKGAGISAGKTLELEWTIYPMSVSELGYFDFINKVREDWNVNVTVPGPYLLFAADVPGLKLQFASITPWFEYADGLLNEDGTMMTREDYKKLMLKKIADNRSKYPGITLMGLVETNLVNFDVTTVPWGYELPVTYSDRKNPKTRYAQYLSPELSRKLNEATPLRDSLLHDKDGNVMIDNHYVYQPKPWINLMPQPELGNARHKLFIDQVDFLLKEVGFDGVYIDQFNPGPVDGISYDKWDGFSVKLDKAGNITSRFYNYAITGATSRMEIVKHIKSYGGVVLTNGHPCTREEQSSGRLSFAEMENDPINPIGYMDKKPPELCFCSMGHLASPIVLNLRPRSYMNRLPAGSPDITAKIQNKGLITALRNGVLPYYYHTDIPLEGPEAGSFEVANWMFPFTPVKLGEGILVGKERTITIVSGSFKIGGSARPALARFNDHGIPMGEEGMSVTGEPGNWTVTVNMNDWNEIACIVKKDAAQ